MMVIMARMMRDHPSDSGTVSNSNVAGSINLGQVLLTHLNFFMQMKAR